MAARDEEVFDAVVRRWSKWWSDVPETLERQESTVVASILNLGLREGGITQSALRKELGMNQPRLSKLMDKLATAGWIEPAKSKGKSRSKKTDSRFRSMTTAGSARDGILSLKHDLKALLRPPRAEKPPARGRATKSGSRARKVTRPQEMRLLPQFLAAETKS